MLVHQRVMVMNEYWWYIDEWNVWEPILRDTGMVMEFPKWRFSKMGDPKVTMVVSRLSHGLMSLITWMIWAGYSHFRKPPNDGMGANFESAEWWWKATHLKIAGFSRQSHMGMDCVASGGRRPTHIQAISRVIGGHMDLVESQKKLTITD